MRMSNKLIGQGRPLRGYASTRHNETTKRRLNWRKPLEALNRFFNESRGLCFGSAACFLGNGLPAWP